MGILRKVEIRSVRHAQLLHGKMYHIASGGVEEAILGSSNFTVASLGVGGANNNIELNLGVDSTRDRRDLKAWFDELWNDAALVADVKDEVLRYLDKLYANHSPQFIYYLTLFHIFRNNKLATQRAGDSEEKPRRSRYQRLMEDIISSGVKTKVLLLSATPVNNQLADLRNQISFIAGGDVARNGVADGVFSGKLSISSIKETTRVAQTHFTNWAKRPPGERKTRELIAAIGGDFFKLLDGLSIARSRRQIAGYYAGEMKQLGGFPHRPPPRAIHAPIDLEQRFLSFEQLDAEISDLRLALYHPTSKLRKDLPEDLRAAYQAKILGGFTQEGRERILIAMMKVNLLKRLESSVDSFRLTLQRTIEKIDRLEERLAAFEQHLNENPDLDRYLGVKHRVEARMALVDLAATQTDNLLDTTQIEDLIKEELLFRDRQLKRLKDEILDLEDLDAAVSLTDFSLDEFRLDLHLGVKLEQ